MKLESCHTLLQRLFNEVVKVMDCTILEGRRGEARQNELHASGASKVFYPNSKHNKLPLSHAVDVAPYISGKPSFERFQCYHFAGYVLSVAEHLGIAGRIRWGGDWDCDHDVNDQDFRDLLHYEIING